MVKNRLQSVLGSTNSNRHLTVGEHHHLSFIVVIIIITTIVIVGAQFHPRNINGALTMFRALEYMMGGREVKRERNKTQVNKSIKKSRLG